MPRPARNILPGVPLHITHRGVDRVRTFYNDADHLRYVEVLAEASRAAGCAVHAWVLMPNHVHLLVTPHETTSASRMMQRLGIRFVRHVNGTYGRTGTLWEGRFRSFRIDSERYLLACARYIELNPVRAGIVQLPEAYRWSSYRHHALGEPDSVVESHALYTGLGVTPRSRQAAWVALCGGKQDDDVTDALRKAIRAPRSRIDRREGTEFARFTDRLGGR